MHDLAKVCIDSLSGRKLSIQIAPTDVTANILYQQVFYSLLNVLKKNTVPKGYALLKMLHSYLELDGLISLDVHMERTLSMIESELLKFNDSLEVSISSNIADLRVSPALNLIRNTLNW